LGIESCRRNRPGESGANKGESLRGNGSKKNQIRYLRLRRKKESASRQSPAYRHQSPLRQVVASYYCTHICSVLDGFGDGEWPCGIASRGRWEMRMEAEKEGVHARNVM
jgi:hypothetical protein